MAYLYFDESIRDNGEFIIGALVISEDDLSCRIKITVARYGVKPK